MMTFFTLFSSVFFCGIFYALKGGSGNVLENWERVREKNGLLDRLLDGKVVSTILFWVFCLIASNGDGSLATALAVAWLVAVAPSMGEEHGAVGDYKSGWGEYLEWLPEAKPVKVPGFEFHYIEGRLYGVKKAVQRGVWMGAAFTVAAGFTGFIWASLLFVPGVFIGQSLNRLVLEQPGWKLAEPLIGAVVVGLPLGLFFAGV